jgi:Zn ribbon nucleic-acid-binding protein
MGDARATCPHCQTAQPVADWRQRDCTQCGRSFYPSPSVDPLLQRKQRARRVLRARDEAAARDPIGRYQAFCGVGGFLVLVLIAQLGFQAVFFTPKNGGSVVILRHEEPQRYWSAVAMTALGASVFLGVGIYGLRRIRARLARRYPEDET